ncbi:hypothetical protein [uncultured Halomonas sp.]|uniref:hypothetical protein n=1 Tax=uncultured Halomonas sp. TaxID=173971 RepID=UPI0026198C78|nr:hypothetical protein [uncultured Halomonas sp.]
MMKLWKKSVNGVNEKYGLLAHRLFWLCVLGPILSAVFLAWFYGLFSLPFDRSLSGVENFYQRAKVFLGVAALSIPIGATFARVHSSSQNARNIVSSTEQNNFRNALDHAQFFEEQLSSHCKQKEKGMAAYHMNKDPFFHYKLLFPESMNGSFENNKLEGIVDQLLIHISRHCSQPGDITAAKKINDKIEEVFQYLETPIFIGWQRKNARLITPGYLSVEDTSFETTENIGENLHLYNLIGEAISPLKVWKIGLDLVDHNTAYFINQAASIIEDYETNFLSKVVENLDFESLKDLDSDEADRVLHQKYIECLDLYKSKGNSIKLWVDAVATDQCF